MSRRLKHRSKKAGLPPGTLIYIGDKKAEPIRITVIHYDESHLHEKEVNRLEECFAFKDKPGLTWINVDGLDVETTEKLGHCFNVPPMVLEDILNTDQRPKLENFDSSLYIVLKMLYCNGPHQNILTEQVSLVVGPNFVLSFQERIGDVFDPVRERLRHGKGSLRKAWPGYLAYALLDTIVDNYFVVLEHVGERIEAIEEVLVAAPTPEIMREVHHLKREMIFLRKAVWPLREVISSLSREELEMMPPLTRMHLRDLYDHTIQVVETIETYREMLAGMIEIYLSSLSNRLNEVMKVLAIISTIFIPLTFISGIYGMNFYIPEVHWPYGYPVVLLAMAAISGVMIVYFKKKNWL